MERDEQTPRKGDTRNPLNNVSSEKIEETRARVRGDMSEKKLVSSPGQMKESDLAIEEAGGLEDSIENVGREGREGTSCEKLQEELGESNLVSSFMSTESDATLLGLSENVEWVRRNFKRPLALAMRDILARKPSDPVDFLASWLLKYRSSQEKLQLRQEQDRELMEERKRIQQFLSETSSKNEEIMEIQKADWSEEEYEGDEAIVDSNFQNYIK